ncbi:MAG TPA: electron transfer flavoprotein subunit beta/FixA family protein [Acidimicrobiia bacterium]|jgi:electron transfer flavoprotein beta subunit|nr:electron transfer flavoprotein subunit beta/FixA family protein [Acidimicrobiia bacterium]
MKIAVCAKQIPDPATPYELDPTTHFVVRPDDQVLDDTDRYGIEVGLQLAEAAGDDSTVTIISMSPSGSLQGIRQALAMGAAKAVVIDDAGLRGSDALTTSRVLAAAIKREEVDVVIAGTESTDGYTGVVPQQIAELLGVPSLTFARKVEHIEGGLRIERQTGAGYDVVEATAPLVLSVTSGVVEPRYPTFKGIMQAKSKPVDTLTSAELGVESAGNQAIQSVDPVPARQAGEIVEDDGESHLKIVALLEQAKVV